MDEEDAPDDKLLTMPETEDRLQSSRRSILGHEHQMAELYAEQNGTSRPSMLLPWSTPHEKQRLEEKHRREQLAFEQLLREVAERQDRLLEQIEHEQAAINEKRREIDDNAIRLRDGRRAYLDGDRFRDEHGVMLTGADEAEAARQHEYRPDASTWAAKQEIERRAAEVQKLYDKMLAESGQGTPEQQIAHLDGYEKEFAAKVQAPPVADYGGGDYMSDYQLSSAPAFNDASGVAKAAAPKPKEDDSESVTADVKKPPQPFGQRGMKLGLS